LLIGDPPERELVVALAELPAQAREGQWLDIELDGDRLVRADIDQPATDDARAKVRSKLDALRRRGRKLE
jgi:hypothetical protein